MGVAIKPQETCRKPPLGKRFEENQKGFIFPGRMMWGDFVEVNTKSTMNEGNIDDAI